MKCNMDTKSEEKTFNKKQIFYDDDIIEEITDSKDLSLDPNEDGEIGRVRFIADYITKKDAESLYNSLVHEIPWQQREGFNNFGVSYPEPRMTFWYGKPYKYSTVNWNENNDWNENVNKLRQRICNDATLQIDSKRSLNSVMCNYYRDGIDSIGWHADDETSLGRCPAIASISLGATRYFDVCKREEYYGRQGRPVTNKETFGGCTKMYRFHLNSGSLLMMTGSVQDNWLHRVPKSNRNMPGRINLTFRYIVDEIEERAEIERKKQRARDRRMVKMRQDVIGDVDVNKRYEDRQMAVVKIHKKHDQREDSDSDLNDTEEPSAEPTKRKDSKNNEKSKLKKLKKEERRAEKRKAKKENEKTEEKKAKKAKKKKAEKN